MSKKEFIYLALNKPKGYVSALKDNLNPTILELVQEPTQNLHIVGRLDKDTTGLILLTNDGSFTHRITHPKKHVAKNYEVTLLKPFSEKDKEFLEKPFAIDYGKTPIKGGKVNILNEYKIHLAIQEGKYHQVKKMIFNIDNEVVALHRIAIGKLKLSDLKLEIGQYKKIKKEDVI
ncbi:pseudouridine synthase [Mycoplasma iguanae]|uniref:Pseudouridine synthase n=1 Tax=Mycoplasma iguanae TaxID=292461 RepID=A0ABY5RAC1_9MOLU|nr:pseudouridine synthase [Mycoplasma iguanae]UVD81729.1 pseudouridine synthase [Mycoplasma iguanae]